MIDNKLNDSLFAINNINYSLTEVLMKNTSLYTRTYGPGLIASYGIRGSNSAQTKVVWNDFNLNNSMIGSTDVSLLNVAETIIDIDKNNLYSGGIGGTIILNDKMPVRSNSVLANISYNSMRNFSFNGMTGYSIKTFNNLFVFSSELDENEYYFLRGTSKYKISNSGAKKMLFKYSGAYHINNTSIKLFVLANKLNRNIPPSRYETISDANQLDEGLKTGFHYDLVKNNITLKIKAGYFIDRLKYGFPLKSIFSDSHIYTMQSGIKLDWNTYKNWIVSIKIDEENTKVRTDIYGNKSESRLYFTGTGFGSLTKSLLLKTGLRSVYYKNQLLPLFPFFQINYLIKNFKFNFNFGNNFRLPGLNDKYWPDVGVIDLKPEISSYVDFNTYVKIGNNLKINWSLYYKTIDNMIQWLPGQGIWKPVNIEKVYSKGVDISFTANSKLDKFQLETILSYGYNKSTNSLNIERNIIYNPSHVLLFVSRFEYEKWYLSMSGRYNSKVYVTYDNTETIPSWFVFDLRIARDIKFKRSYFKYIMEINNILNKDYETIKNYSMPGRNLSIGIKYFFNYQK